MEKKDFIKRLVGLRTNKGVSARDMSLSIRKSAGNISNIENGVNFPSMAVFFYIFEHLVITPKEFFDTEVRNPSKSHELFHAVQGLRNEQLERLIAIAKELK